MAVYPSDEADASNRFLRTRFTAASRRETRDVSVHEACQLWPEKARWELNLRTILDEVNGHRPAKSFLQQEAKLF
jgi:hypothetical protein